MLFAHDPKLSGESTTTCSVLWSLGHLVHVWRESIFYTAEAAAVGMGFKGPGSCKCRTLYEIIVPNEEKAACFVQFHKLLVSNVSQIL